MSWKSQSDRKPESLLNLLRPCCDTSWVKYRNPWKPQQVHGLMQARRPSNIEPNRLYLVLKTKRTGSWCCYFAVMQMQRSAPSGFQPKALFDWVQHGATWGMEWPLQALQSVQLDRTALFGLTCEAGEKGFHRLGRQPLFYTKQFQQFVQFEQLTTKNCLPDKPACVPRSEPD